MKWIPAVIIALVAAACSSASGAGATSTTSTTAATATTTTTVPAEPAEVVVTIEDDGGCFMMGPNCSTYVVYSDGTVELYRTNYDGPAEATAAVPVGLVDKIRDLVATTDLDALRSSLPEGELTAAYDGVDTVFTYATASGDEVFASATVELVSSEPLFATTWQIRTLAQRATDLPMQSWP